MGVEFVTICKLVLYFTHRDIVKLTAQFVARNGAQFLDKLMVREQRNYQFDFLRKQHPLFNYFTKLVEQYSKILMPAHTRIHQLNLFSLPLSLKTTQRGPSCTHFTRTCICIDSTLTNNKHHH